MSSPLTTRLYEGSLTFFTGPMSCGKTLELIRHLQIFKEQQVPMICLRPSSDVRTPVVQSRSGLSLVDAVSVDAEDLTRIAALMHDKFVIGIDEIIFFPPSIVPLLEAELRRGKTIMVAGLDNDFSGKLFPTSASIMELPETIIQRSRAVCSVCRRYNATRTQRLRDGKPVAANDPQELVEGSVSNVTYEARCLEHHELAPMTASSEKAV
jgi:thymidine kinase